MSSYIIIGNGVAGNAAAEAVRKHDPDGEIHLFARERYPFYYLPALPDYIAGNKHLSQIIIHDLDWYKSHQITLHLETEIVGIDPDQKTVATTKGQQYRYDKLLLASGGYAFMPPIKGLETESAFNLQTIGIFTLRTFDDAEAIKKRAAQGGTAVLIGGGLLGLEAGNGLRQAGMKVKVVEVFPRLLPRQMDVTGAGILQKQLENMGFSFYLGTTTEEIRHDAGTCQVFLKSGEKLAADLVLISAGTRPDLTLAKALSLDIDKAVKVDGSMRTSRRDIFAAGDLVEHRGRYYGIWPASLEQGRTAGMAMAGLEVKYEGTMPANTLKVVGIDLMSAGEIDVDNKYISLVSLDEPNKIYRKLVVQDNVLIGAILLGDIQGAEEIQEAIRLKQTIGALKPMAIPDFDLSRLGQST
jgi:NAD(P)H-nitrite reductase large subunit